MFCIRAANGPAQYHEGYSKLRSWTYNSLDRFRVSVSFIRISSYFILQVFTLFIAGSQLRLIPFCSMSYFVCCTPCSSTVLWIWQRTVIFKKVFLRASFLIVKKTTSGFNSKCGLNFQLEPSLIPSARTMKSCTHETYRSWKESSLHLIWRFVSRFPSTLFGNPESNNITMPTLSLFSFQEMEFAHTYRQSKVNIKICQVTLTCLFLILLLLCFCIVIVFLYVYRRSQ